MKKSVYLLPLVLLSLLVATTAGWLRLGIHMPISVSAGQHGAMMVGSFLGTLISLERAVVIRKYWAYAGPVLSVISIFFFLSEHNQMAMGMLTAASLAYAIMLYHLYLKHSEKHMLLMIGGALCWLIGNLLLIKSQLYPLAVSWWMGFLLLTIVGERLELSRFLPSSKLKVISFWFAAGIFLLGLLLPFHGPGRILFGSGLVFLGLWLYRFDMARMSVRKKGMSRFVGVSLLCGYVWLLVCGALCLFSDFYYDAVLHSFFIGFVFSMIFAHGPIILPGVVGLKVKLYHTFLFVWLIGLQFSLLLRIWGSLAGLAEIQRWAGALNGIIILAYLISLGTIAMKMSLKTTKPAKARC